ncbi:bifunctional heptose 7-phosphate kinase/heptose 1-phosphate adenyltransferase [Leptolyngbya sp. NIES-2104]|uniref:bifunctional heptose 7-phosphate kinase/heptose 1-phosphate adenyltransferase n=1 Tax=Leptolyngbya sp. NIES-2104 TaxID=1552121 RepID=UPI0006ECA734|nr:PfkB family carbohydrate kinase [Leptolyngbya sp. NIES-2104]GAP95354.1 ADP-heptose synthase / D-glycero-beta-D-manno-heptose 7-phosphate kinase [Leptolyngbya sp. NIES-2104]
MSEFLSVLEQFSRSHILVIGEAMLDRYLYGDATRLCQETPVPVVTLSQTIDQPGGAANTAMNLQSLGAEVTLLSVVGEDWEGMRLQRVLPGIQGIFTASDRTTLTKQRVMNGDRLLLRFDQGTTAALSTELENKLITELRTHWNHYDAIIISDYGYGILTDRIINTIHQLQQHHPKILIVDAKNLINYQHLDVTAVKPNYQQMLNLLNQEDINFSRIQFVKHNAAEILEKTGAKIVAVTLDREGVILLQRDRAPYQIRANPACPTQTIGAGDTFTATFAIALTITNNSTIAAELAAAAAAIVVQKPGTARCTLEELQSMFNHVLEPS